MASCDSGSLFDRAPPEPEADDCTPPPHDWAQLPPDLLAAILQHVSLQQRFSTCALVNTAWAAAAAAVPVTTLSTGRGSAAALKATWEGQARRFGPQLTRLSLYLGGLGSLMALQGVHQSPILQLPCPGLRDLALLDVVVNLTQHAAVSVEGELRLLAAVGLAPLSTLTGLTKLRMQDVSLLGQPQQRLEALAALTGLQHLDANGVQHVPGLEGARRLFDLAGTSGPPLLPDGLLPRLHGLTYLSVDAYGMFYSPAVSVAGLQDVSCLTGLQHLGLNLSAVMQEVVAVPGGIPGLTELTQLTYLKLRQVGGTSLPNLAPLTALQRLELLWCGSLPATVLTGLTSLQSVHLVFVGLDDAANATLFLSWLKQQAHKTTLVMRGMGFATPEFDLPDLPAESAAAAFAGLTAASKLQQLVLKDMLPRSAWQHLFPAGQLCTGLTYLNIDSCHSSESFEMLQRIAAACPNLQQARIDPRFGSGGTTAVSNLPSLALQPLTVLTTLVIQGVAEEHIPHRTAESTTDTPPWISSHHCSDGYRACSSTTAPD